MSVVSSSRLVLGMGMAYASRETIRGRLFKFALRCVGEHHFALPRSGNKRSVMYAPIRGLPDVDLMGFELDPNPTPAGSK